MTRKKPVEPDEMRMRADEFDAIMRRALGVPPPSQAPKPSRDGKKAPAKKDAPRIPKKGDRA